MKRIIKWESQHLEIDTMSGKLEFPDDEDDENYESYEEDDTSTIQKNSMQNVMSTAFGLWKVDDTMNPYRQFKLWIGHTNFTVSADIVEVIKNIPGVEVLKILSRYRFLVGVGELFNIRDVRIAIEKELGCNKEATHLIIDQKVKKEVNDLKETLSTYDQWAIYVFPNGQIDCVTSEQQDFQQQLNRYKQAADFSNGILIESPNEQNIIQ